MQCQLVNVLFKQEIPTPAIDDLTLAGIATELRVCSSHCVTITMCTSVCACVCNQELVRVKTWCVSSFASVALHTTSHKKFYESTYYKPESIITILASSLSYAKMPHLLQTSPWLKYSHFLVLQATRSKQQIT